MTVGRNISVLYSNGQCVHCTNRNMLCTFDTKKLPLYMMIKHPTVANITQYNNPQQIHGIPWRMPMKLFCHHACVCVSVKIILCMMLDRMKINLKHVEWRWADVRKLSVIPNNNNNILILPKSIITTVAMTTLIQFSWANATIQLCKCANQKPTLLDSASQQCSVERRDRADGSTQHLIPDLCHFFQTRRQLLILWYRRMTRSFSNRGTALLRLLWRQHCNNKSRLKCDFIIS